MGQPHPKQGFYPMEFPGSLLRALRVFRLLNVLVVPALVWMILHYRTTRAAAKQELLRLSEDVDRLRRDVDAKMADLTLTVDDIASRSPAPERVHREHVDSDPNGGDA